MLFRSKATKAALDSAGSGVNPNNVTVALVYVVANHENVPIPPGQLITGKRICELDEFA